MSVSARKCFRRSGGACIQSVENRPRASCKCVRFMNAGRSDDSSFLQRKIPAVIFFTGFHADYHRPSDDVEKLDAAGTARIAALALEFAARIAARPDRPALAD